MEGVVVQDHTREHGEGDIDPLIHTVDLNGLVLTILVVKADGHLAALTLELLGGYGLPIQIIAHGQTHRQLLLDIALVVDVIALGIPYGHVVAVYGVGLIALDIFNVTQIGLVRNRCTAQFIF